MPACGHGGCPEIGCLIGTHRAGGLAGESTPAAGALHALASSESVMLATDSWVTERNLQMSFIQKANDLSLIQLYLIVSPYSSNKATRK